MTFKEILTGPEKTRIPESLTHIELNREKLLLEIENNPELINTLPLDALTRNLEVHEGQIQLFGKPISYWIINFSLSEEFLSSLSTENLKETQTIYQKSIVLNDVLEIWIEKATEIASTVIFKSLREDDDIIIKQVQKIQESYRELSGQIFQLDEVDFNKKMAEIFSMIQIAEAQENIIGNSDIAQVEKLIVEQEVSEQNWLRIMNTMRYGGWSGNSKGVRKKLEQRILMQEGFEEENTTLTTNFDSIITAFKNKNTNFINSYFGKETGESLEKAYQKIAQEISKSVKHESDGKLDQEVEGAIEAGIYEGFASLLREDIILKKISAMENRGDDNSTLTGIYADMNGLGETNGLLGDALSIGDENIDSAIEVGGNLALLTLTLGAGTAAMIGGRVVIGVGGRVLGISNTALKSSKIGRFGLATGVATLDGITFYEGSIIMSNLMHRELSEVFSETGNIKEIAKSIAFMGALNGVMYGAKSVSGLLKTSGATGYVQGKIGKNFLSPRNTEQILKASSLGLTTAVIYSISGVLETKFGEGWEPSLAGYFELMALLVVFHRAQEVGKIGTQKIYESIPRKASHATSLNMRGAY